LQKDFSAKPGGRQEDAKVRRAKSHENIGGNSARERSGPEVMHTDGLGEMSEETMHKRRQVYERLYSMGVVKVKKQQHMQEQKRREQEEQLKKERQQVTANPTKMLAVTHTHTTHTHAGERKVDEDVSGAQTGRWRQLRRIPLQPRRGAERHKGGAGAAHQAQRTDGRGKGNNLYPANFEDEQESSPRYACR